MPVLELGEISRRMFFTYGAVGSGQSGLDISKHGIDPLEDRFLGCLCASAGYDLGMRVWVYSVRKFGLTQVRNQVGFWAYLGDRLGVPDAPAIARLAELIRAPTAA